MITHINGIVSEISPTYVVLDANGIGYFINISLNTYSDIKELKECKLLTHLQIREDAHTLYGFFKEDERKLFRALVSVSGVGANTARMILSSLTAEEVYSAILEKNISVFQAVKGIGAKSAQRIIVDLYDKLKKEDFTAQISSPVDNTLKEEALSALVALGFTKSIAEKVIKKVVKENTNIYSVEVLIKEALNRL